MQIIYRMSIELTRRSALAPLDAVQGDGNTRAVKISLLENGSPWEVPAGVTAAVAFRKSDGTKGLYDTLPDGSKAVTIDGSAVTAVLAPQVLSCAGSVSAAVVFYDGTLQQLATFPFTIRVEKNPAAGQEISNDYYRFSTMEAVSEAVDAALASLETAKQDFLTRAEDALSVVHDTATADAPAIVCESAGESIRVSDSADRPLKGLTLCGKTTQSGTPTPENPAPLVSVGASGVVTATVAGKNLVDASKFQQRTLNGITFENVASGGVHVSGTATDYANVVVYPKLPKGRYAVSGVNSVTNAAYVFLQCVCADGKNKNTFSGGVAEIDGTEKEVRCFVQVNPNVTVDTVIYPMLEAGETVTDFEPYKELQTITVSTPNGLPGIPVASGGNYTDENGQQWICDEIDFARGVYVQRVAEKVLTGTETVNNLDAIGDCVRARLTLEAESVTASASAGLFSHSEFRNGYVTDDTHAYTSGISLYIFLPASIVETSAEFQSYCLEEYSVGNPLTVQYVLAIPSETALSADELAQYAALHTNKPNTTVFNDSGAGMKLNYVADTKTYIDNKFAAISAAMLNA